MQVDVEILNQNIEQECIEHTIESKKQIREC
jgi:hypothetical protein